MAEKGYLLTGIKDECFGCEACSQVCGHSALRMVEDEEGFKYPVLDKDKCIGCNLCHRVCPYENNPNKHIETQEAFGGYCKDQYIREQSTSGGAFSALVDSWCDKDYVIFGAVADGLTVHHTYITDKTLLQSFRKSKYSQSIIGNCFKEVSQFLKEGKKVLFSGTPCQIGGLQKYLEVRKTDTTKLLTIEVVCEGVPSPLYIRKLDNYMLRKYGGRISYLDYRYKDNSKWDFECMYWGIKDKGKWDFQVMQFFLGGDTGLKFKKDRWFNPFWSIWLNHLMSRPSCYGCPYATRQRVADITLGDLWGVHIYCPELYGNNGGSSVIVVNSEKGKSALSDALSLLYGHSLNMEDVIRYQGPMRKSISMNPARVKCMEDLENPDMTYEMNNKKWAKGPSFKLLFQKYIWGNRQKVWLWNLKHRKKR